MQNKKYISLLIIGLMAVGLLVVAAPILAQNDRGEYNNNSNEQFQKPVVSGTVSAISGNILTVSSKQESDKENTTKTFTVDATNATITRNGVAGTVASIVVGDRVSAQGTLTETNIVATVIKVSNMKKSEVNSDKMTPNIVGKVSAISGNIVTVISKQGFMKATPKATTTLTVDATNAKILRGKTEIKVSDIAVGDNVVIQGTITGTNVVATLIRDGKVGEGKSGEGNSNDNNQALLQIEGNGQPIVAGTVSTIAGSIITIANSSNVTYTVDATNAKIIQGKNIILLSGVKTGDLIIAQGTINGTSVVASTIIDQTKQGAKLNSEPKRGFFGSMGQFFRHMFGF
jgi:hypothetical protein